jgi:endonuclease YncB( thermonuclease family)
MPCIPIVLCFKITYFCPKFQPVKNLLFPLFLFVAAISNAQPVTVTVLAVHDGDGYNVQFPDGKKMWVRLWGCDAPEVFSPYVTEDQIFGPESGKKMRTMLKGKTIQIDTLYRDQFKRPVAKIQFNGMDLTTLAVTNGLAWAEKAKGMTVAEHKELMRLQKMARAGSLGLFGMPGRKIKPSTFRKKHRPFFGATKRAIKFYSL